MVLPSYDKITEKTPQVTFPREWNHFQATTTSATPAISAAYKPKNFKNELKNNFLAKYYEVCQLKYCYSCNKIEKTTKNTPHNTH